MSNIRANNPPEPSRTDTVDLHCNLVEVQILWDPSVSTWRSRLNLQDKQIVDAVIAAASWRGYHAGEVGVRITDDQTIHQINARHLSHDYPTDVISFPYSDRSDVIEGELVASVETAAINAADAGWETADELLLYIIHGVLHIGGMDDHDEADRAEMRRAERAVLTSLGMTADPAAEGKLSG